MNQDRVQQALEKTRGGTMPIKRDTSQQTVQIITHAPRCNYRKRKHDAARHYKKPEGISEFEIDYTEHELNDLLALEKRKRKKQKNHHNSDKKKGKGNTSHGYVVEKKPLRDFSLVTCFKCGDKGHYVDKCPENKPQGTKP